MKRKLYRLVALLVALFIFITSYTSVAASAANNNYAPSYFLYNAFIRDSYPEIRNGKRMYLITLEESENKNYFFFINRGWLLDRASWALNKDLDTNRCIEILTNIVTMVNHQLEDGITQQATENTKQQIKDFALDSVGAITGLIGLDDFQNASNAVIRSIPTVTGIASDTLNLTVDSIEELELLNQLLGDYTMQYDFLNAVATYADLEPMREAAQTILSANEQILSHKLDTFANVSEATAVFLAKDVFIDKVAEEMLKDSSNFSSESTMFATSMAVGAHKIVAQAQLAFDLTILIGDGLFGTNNTYQQYSEMKAMRDIRGSLIEFVDNNPISVESDTQKMTKNIEQLKALQYVDAWGETCVYTAAKNDGSFIGIWPRDTSIMDQNYQNSIDYFSSRVELLDSIYNDISPDVDNSPPEIMTEEDRTISIYESVENITGGHCRWLSEGDFDDNGTNEIYAYVSPSENNNSEGEIWYLSEDETHRIFWLTDGECTFYLNIFDMFPSSVSVNIIKFVVFVDDLVSKI